MPRKYLSWKRILLDTFKGNCLEKCHVLTSEKDLQNQCFLPVHSEVSTFLLCHALNSNSNNTNTFCAATLSTSKHFTNTGLDSVWSSTDVNFLLKPWLCYSEWQISHCLQWGWDFTRSLSKNLGKANLLKEVNVIAERRWNLSSLQGTHKFSKWRTGTSRLLGQWQREESLTNYSPLKCLFSPKSSIRTILWLCGALKLVSVIYINMTTDKQLLDLLACL